MHINMVLIFKRYTEVETAGLWQQHVTEEDNMLPYMLPAGHTKYIACMPHYLQAMRHIPPDVVKAFIQGNFTVHVTSGKFNGI